MTYYVYIMASAPNGVLYVGVTNDILRRAFEHREGQLPGFTRRYGLKLLVHYESFSHVEEAIWREKRLKTWNRAWKVRLIQKTNPGWNDLYETLTP